MTDQSRQEKPEGYFAGVRDDFVTRLPEAPQARLLDIGCGAGGTGRAALAAGKCGVCVGVELSAEQAAIARRHLTDVVQGDIESDAVRLDPPAFDIAILSEVLEHLRDPWAALGKVAAALKPGATVLASSPNVAHYKIIRALRRGRFDYADIGAMDRTHLRWFTPATYAEMFSDAGFEVVAIWPPTRPTLRRRLAGAVCRGGPQRYWPQMCVEARRR